MKEIICAVHLRRLLTCQSLGENLYLNIFCLKKENITVVLLFSLQRHNNRGFFFLYHFFCSQLGPYKKRMGGSVTRKDCVVSAYLRWKLVHAYFLWIFCVIRLLLTHWKKQAVDVLLGPNLSILKDPWKSPTILHPKG